MNTSSDAVGSLDVAVAHAARLLESQPSLAAEQALEILKVVPDHPPALLLLASARRRSGNPTAALETLESLLRAHGQLAVAHFEHGLALASAGRGDEAIQALRKTVELKPDHPEAWQFLADHLLAVGDSEGADAAYARHVQCSTRNPQLQHAAVAMVKNDIAKAEQLLKAYLKQTPTDAPAIRMLAEVAVRCGRDDDAEKLLVRCLELAPAFSAARFNYAQLLHRHSQSREALVEIERLLAVDPRNPGYRNLWAVILTRFGEYGQSSRIYAELLNHYPANAKVWLSYGHVLKTEGRQDQCIDAYRKCIARNPAFGEAYWSLANLKTFRFSEDDLSAMQAQVANENLDDIDRLHFHFALGKAFEDAGNYSKSFEHYAKGNAVQRSRTHYDADQNTARIKYLKAKFTHTFFSERAGFGHEARDPIFIVGMPRAGSTLLEQILSSHSEVEGTSELPEIIAMAKDLREQAESREITTYCEVLASMSAGALRELGERYIERTRIHRKTDAPFFIDKMPNNFLHVGLIHLVLPNAKIIDARRHPLACCFSNFKQHYARGQLFSYGLSEMARFYCDYVELMAHFDEVLPGHIHRVFYERMIDDTETEVRRLLDYCGLPFEADCLRFFENERPVRTASSEQVRQPIYRDGIEQWRHYEAWLDTLKSSLGPVLDAYPAVPRF